MNGQSVVERVRQAKETELTRLKSDKTLLAATRAQLDTDVVLGVVVATERTLGDVYEEWADRVTTADAQQAFADAAETAANHETALGGDAGETGESLVQPVEYDQPIDAVGGALVGQSLVFDGLLLQSINFFVNEADERHADAMRDVRSDVNSRIDDGAFALDALCTDEAEWDRAQAAAETAIETAYGQYVERLGEMGIDPKPVC